MSEHQNMQSNHDSSTEHFDVLIVGAGISSIGAALAQLAGPHIEKQILLFLQEQDRLRERFITALKAP